MVLKNLWWRDKHEEIYWMEITDRPDLGTDLHAPQRGNSGKEIPSYSLIREIAPGDIVFHYHKDSHAILAWSMATGSVWDDEIVWGAHGTSSRSAGIRPYSRPGWRLGLERFTQLSTALQLSELREQEETIQQIRNELALNNPGSLYFPFALSEKRPLRPDQGYLAKFPLALVRELAQLNQIMSRREIREKPLSPYSVTPTNPTPGGPYRSANEQAAVSQRDPFTVDPALVERALRGHATTQNSLAVYVREKGREPRSPQGDEANFDLLWQGSNCIYVAEVKSLSDSNEEKQLRLGIGQLLRYQQLLSQNERVVKAILVTERRPKDLSWCDLCAKIEILLVWPEDHNGAKYFTGIAGMLQP